MEKKKRETVEKKRLVGTLNGIETETEIKQKEEHAKYHQFTIYVFDMKNKAFYALLWIAKDACTIASFNVALE